MHHPAAIALFQIQFTAAHISCFVIFIVANTTKGKSLSMFGEEINATAAIKIRTRPFM